MILGTLYFQNHSHETLTAKSVVMVVPFTFRGIYRLNRNTTEVETIGEAVFARITDLKFIEKIGMLCYFQRVTS